VIIHTSTALPSETGSQQPSSGIQYTSRITQEAKMLLDNGHPQLEEAMDYKAVGLK